MNQSQQTQALRHYAHAYQQLYKKSPSDLRMIESGWVMVNGARMRVDELEYLTIQLQKEHNQQLAKRRGVVQRLIGWLAKH